jgi:NAD(P)-dependent dehydrogenase (short-subunit alcohol dehydrogenase family)
MIPAKKGCILFTASVASVLYGELAHAYTASKNATVGLAKNLSVDLGQHGIRVNSISPTAVATPMLTDALRMTKEAAEKFVASAANLKEAVLEPEDVAQAALYLASDDSKYVSGVNLVIDGGYNLTNPSLAMAMKSLFSKV